MTVALPATVTEIEARRDGLRDEVRHHRREAKRAQRALERLEADCARVGIRLIHEPRQTHEQGESHGTRPDPHDR